MLKYSEPTSVILFKSVSKHWYSLIKQRAANLTLGRKPDPPSGLFFSKNSGSYDFVPLDNRIPLRATNFPFGPDVDILHACNGLLLCYTSSLELYVYNPSVTNMFRLIPRYDHVTYNIYSIRRCFQLAFDPTKSPHYKVVYAELVLRASGDCVQIHTFSSQTGNWSLCGHRFPHPSFDMFGPSGVYWDGAIYWSSRATLFKLDIMMNDHPVLTVLPTPLTLGNQHSLFESRGRLLLVGNVFGDPRHTIYEKGNLDSEWSLKRIVNSNKVISPERFTTDDKIVCVVLGERNEDSFLVWRLGTKVVQHKMYPKMKQSKTLSTISDFGPNDKLRRCFQFIPSFASV